MSAISNATCPVCRTAEVISGKWTLLVIRDLADGNRRFCELERSLEGISPRTLSLRLRALEEQGIVERDTYPEVPPRVEYALTEKGEALVPLIEDMRTTARAGFRGTPPKSARPPSQRRAALPASTRAAAGGRPARRKLSAVRDPVLTSASQARRRGGDPAHLDGRQRRGAPL